MLEPYDAPIDDLTFVYAHTGRGQGNGNRIYAFAAVRVAQGRPAKAFCTLVRFDGFTTRERYRSGLSAAALEKAPPPETARKEIARFLNGRTTALAFGAGSDLEAVKRFCTLRRLVDLDFCAAFFLQQLSSHSFKRLWEFFHRQKRDRVSFSAEEIARLSVDLVKFIAGTELNDQKNPSARAIRFFLEKSDTLMGKMLLSACRHFRQYFQALFTPCARPDTADWYQFLKPAPRIDALDEAAGPHRAVSPETIFERFKAMSTSGKGIALRPSQVDYARKVAGALNQGAALCIEAGTGTGKTQGYLVPVLEFLWRNPGQRVAIATYTKSLQEQIFQKETVQAKGMFKIYGDIPVAYLKGKSSYVCAEKLEARHEPGATGDRLLAWLYLLNNLYKFPAADLDSISDAIRPHLNRGLFFTHTLGLVSARQGCTPRHRFCPAHVVTARARSARLVITNHHKLALMEKDPLLKGLFRNCVIDEANHFERAVRGAFRDEANTADLANTLNYLEKRAKKITARASGADAETLASGRQGIHALRREIEALRAALASINPGIGIWEERGLTPGHPGFRQGDVRTHLEAIAAVAVKIETSLKIVADKSVQRSLKIVARTARKIGAELELLRGFAETVHLIAVSLAEQNNVVSYLVFKNGFALFSAPVEVDEIIRKQIYAERDAVVYTAATLCHDQRFDCFKKIVGLERPIGGGDGAPAKPIRESMIPSHFSPDSMRLKVHPESLTGNFSNKSGWLERVASLLPGLVETNRGRTLVLFSSYHDLQFAASRTFDPISGAGYPMLVQKPGEPTIGLCDAFRTIKESVLFGVDTFWYGVDFPGDTLTQVIITRMPYPSPGDPIQSARKNLLSARQYWARYHYENEIKVKQGIGRLIRTETDSGTVVFLDSRFEKIMGRIR